MRVDTVSKTTIPVEMLIVINNAGTNVTILIDADDNVFVSLVFCYTNHSIHNPNVSLHFITIQLLQEKELIKY